MDYNLLLHGVYWGYSPFTNHLPTPLGHPSSFGGTGAESAETFSRGLEPRATVTEEVAGFGWWWGDVLVGYICCLEDDHPMTCKWLRSPPTYTNHHGLPKPAFLEVFTVNTLVFWLLFTLFFMAFGGSWSGSPRFISQQKGYLEREHCRT